MAKYSYEFKRIVVDEYLSGQGGCNYLSQKYSLTRSLIQRWVSNYRHFGDDGLRRSRQKQKYTFEFKLHVVELYLSSELSYQTLASQVGMTNSTLITQWVNNYRAAGPEALKPKKKGRKRTMDKEKVVSTKVPVPVGYINEKRTQQTIWQYIISLWSLNSSNCGDVLNFIQTYESMLVKS
jgi:transposase